MNLPSKILQNTVNQLSLLPGVGKITALRLALYLLKIPQTQGEELSESIKKLVQSINYCKKCSSLSDEIYCDICKNPNRDQKIICVVEDIRDVVAIENTNQYKGLYHVLGGIISPMNGVFPSDLTIELLIERVKEQGKIQEIIFALSSTTEGDTTMFYIHKKTKHLALLTFSTIARGIGLGEELEYLDEMTLAHSIIERIPYK